MVEVKSSTSKVRYLVIDDEIAVDELYQQGFIDQLDLPGAVPLFVGSCEEAIEAIKSNPDISLGFLDYRLPQKAGDFSCFDLTNPPSGMTLIPEIKLLRDKFTIIAYSAYIEITQLIKETPNVGVPIIAYLKKLESPEKFREAFFKALDLLDSNLSREIKSAKRELKENSENAAAEVSKFSYSDFDAETAKFARNQGKLIRNTIKQTAQNIVDIGRYLQEAKETLPYGKFVSWATAETGLSTSQIYRLTNVYSRFREVDLNNAEFAITALYNLADKNVPLEATQEAIKEANSGKTISTEAADLIIGKHKQKHKKEDKNKSSSNQIKGQSAALEGVLSNTERDTPSQKIVKTLPLQREWKFNNGHRLFCCDPNSDKFINCLPSKVELVLNYPLTKSWQFSFTDYITSNTFYCQSLTNDDSAELVYAKDLIDFQSSLASFQLKQSKELALDHTDARSVVVVCFIPDPQILNLLHKLGCIAYIAEPNRELCLALVEESKNILEK